MLAKSPFVGNKQAAAPAETAEVTKRRREISSFLFIPVSPNNFHQTSRQEVQISAVAKPSFITNRSRHTSSPQYNQIRVNVYSLSGNIPVLRFVRLSTLNAQPLPPCLRSADRRPSPDTPNSAKQSAHSRSSTDSHQTRAS